MGGLRRQNILISSFVGVQLEGCSEIERKGDPGKQNRARTVLLYQMRTRSCGGAPAPPPPASSAPPS